MDTLPLFVSGPFQMSLVHTMCQEYQHTLPRITTFFLFGAPGGTGNTSVSGHTTHRSKAPIKIKYLRLIVADHFVKYLKREILRLS